MGQKKSADDHVIPFYESPYFDYRPYDRSMVRIQQACRKWLTTTLGREDFDFLYSKHLLELTGSRPDLVHCQNLHGGYFDLHILAEISHQVPLFLTLHDCWSFTGHCAHSFDCEGWQTGCGSCPYLSNPPAVRRDSTRWNWRRKRKYHARCRFHVAAASDWLLQHARKSILAPAIIDSQVITPGVDLTVFKPAPRSARASTWGFPRTRPSSSLSPIMAAVIRSRIMPRCGRPWSGSPVNSARGTFTCTALARKPPTNMRAI